MGIKLKIIFLIIYFGCMVDSKQVFNKRKKYSYNLFYLFNLKVKPDLTESVSELPFLVEPNKINGIWLNQKIIKTERKCIKSLAVLPSGDLISGTDSLGDLKSANLKIWNVTEGIEKFTFYCSKNCENDATYSLLVLPNGDLISGGWDSSIRIWDLKSNVEKITLPGFSTPVRSFTILANGDLVSGYGNRNTYQDFSIRIWNLKERKVKKILLGHYGEIWSLATLQNGDLASASGDGTIRIWNVNEGNLKKILKEHNGSVWSLVILPNGDLVSGSSDGKIKIWNVNFGYSILTFETYAEIYSLALLPNGDIVSGSSDGIIRIWNFNKKKVTKKFKGHKGPIFSLVVLQNGDIASGSNDGFIKIWRHYQYY